MKIERELKFSSTEEHVPSLPELRQALGTSSLELGPETIRRHVDSYYDDRAGSLRRAGWALRKRRSIDKTIATLKGAPSAVGDAGADGQAGAVEDAGRGSALQSRPELEVELDEVADRLVNGWPPEIAAALPPAIDLGAVRELVELRVRRVAVAVTRAGSPVAELAFDEVICSVPGNLPGATLEETPHFTFHEVEIEALAGDHEEAVSLAALDEVGLAVNELLPLVASSASKLERATALLGPFIEDLFGDA